MARLWSFLSAEQISIVCTLQAWHLFKQFVAQLAAWCPHYYFIMFLLNVEHDVGLRPFFRLPESVRDTLGSKKSDQIVAAIDELYLESGSTSQMVMASAKSPTSEAREERTLCRPVFEEGDQPLNHLKHFNFPTQLPQVEFETSKVILGFETWKLV